MTQTLGSTARVRWISPHVVSSEMERLQKLASELAHLAQVVADSYEELYEASLSPSRTGEEVKIRRAGWSGNDETSAVALSGMHQRLRRQARRAAGTLRKVTPMLEQAENIIVEAFAETDPEFQEKLKRLRELEEAIEHG